MRTRDRLATSAALALLGLALLSGAASSGCDGGSAYRLNSRSRPAGDARAVVNLRQEGGQTQVRLAARRLPEPHWVRPAAKVWRVWGRTGTDDASWQNLGDLDGGGQLAWVRAPGARFELWVTAEINPRAIGPTFGPTFSAKLP